MNITINCNRIMIRPLTTEELMNFLRYRNKKWILYDILVNELIYDEVMAQAIKIKIQKMRSVSPVKHPWLTYWLMIEKTNKEAVGMIGFKHFPVNGIVEVGFGMAKLFEGQGYMTEALNGLVQWAFSHKDCAKIIANTQKWNIASQRVLEKNRFKYIKMLDEILDYELEKTLDN